MSLTDDEIIRFVGPFTSVSKERLINVLNLVTKIHQSKLEGDFIEIGVWRGGIIMAMALKCKQLGMTRKIHAYDTFEGMTAPTANDVDLNGAAAVNILAAVKCESSFEDTKRNIDMADYPHIEYHVGDILKATQVPSQIALLRLDTDWYESTRFELEVFEPNVVSGGYIVVDDYGHWQGCKKAVDEFMVGKDVAIQKIDYTGIWWQKALSPDSVVQAVIRKFQERSEFGMKKYGVTLDRTDLGPLDWIQHAQDELMDGILYLERLKKELPRSSL